MALATKTLNNKRRTRNSLSPSEILEAALHIIVTEGIENLSMRRIARELNCSVASPYAHFKNQQEIIESLITVGESKLTEDLKKARAKEDDIFMQLSAIAHTYWEFATANRELHKLMFNTLETNKHRKMFRSPPRSYRIFLDTLRTGIKTGKINLPKNEYHAIARTMWAWIYGLIVLELTGMLNVHHRDSNPIGEGVEYFQKLLKQSEKI